VKNLHLKICLDEAHQLGERRRLTAQQQLSLSMHLAVMAYGNLHMEHETHHSKAAVQLNLLVPPIQSWAEPQVIYHVRVVTCRKQWQGEG